VEFKAGRCVREESSNQVTPEKRVGVVTVKKNQDGLLQFAWKDKATGTVAEELTLIPEDAVFRKVEESNGRVYLLEFKTSTRKFFYWMQDKSSEKDEENCQLVNKYINNPNSGNTQETGSGTGGGTINSQQLYNILNRTRPQAPRTGSTTSETNETPPQTTSNQGTGTSSNQGTGTGTSQNTLNLTHLKSLLERHSTKPTGPTLKDILDVREIQNSEILQDNEVMDRLKEHLPEGNDSTPQTAIANIRSPQFHDALETFVYALRHSPDFAGVLLSLGLDPNLAGPNTTIEEFLIALQDVVDQRRMDTDK